jgi:oxaloacetate decarboxylase alpha subunit
MVTPVSQFVATQATMNVVGGERWRDVSDEMVRYFLGHFYEPAAPVDPEVAERVLSRPRAAELRDLEPLSLEGARERFGSRISEEELLLRLTMPAEQVDAMVSGQGAERPAPVMRPGEDPLVWLLREVAKRESISYMRLETEDDLVVWRRAA